MSWVKLDDHFPEHDKVAELHDRAFRLHLIALCYCSRNLTDGRIGPRQLKVIQAVLGSASKRWVTELVAADLWLVDGDGHAIKDYLDYNPPADHVREVREARREAGRVGGLRSGETRAKQTPKQKGKQIASQDASSALVEPRPVPFSVCPKAVTGVRSERPSVQPSAFKPPKLKEAS